MWSLCNICWLYWMLGLEGIFTWDWTVISTVVGLSNLGCNCTEPCCVHKLHDRLHIPNWIMLQAWIWIFSCPWYGSFQEVLPVWYKDLSTSRGPSALNPLVLFHHRDDYKHYLSPGLTHRGSLLSLHGSTLTWKDSVLVHITQSSLYCLPCLSCST